jgi:hypothetical protein
MKIIDSTGRSPMSKRESFADELEKILDKSCCCEPFELGDSLPKRSRSRGLDSIEIREPGIASPSLASVNAGKTETDQSKEALETAEQA